MKFRHFCAWHIICCCISYVCWCPEVTYMSFLDINILRDKQYRSIRARRTLWLDILNPIWQHLHYLFRFNIHPVHNDGIPPGITLLLSCSNLPSTWLALRAWSIGDELDSFQMTHMLNGDLIKFFGWLVRQRDPLPFLTCSVESFPSVLQLCTCMIKKEIWQWYKK